MFHYTILVLHALKKNLIYHTINFIFSNYVKRKKNPRKFTAERIAILKKTNLRKIFIH